MADKEIDILLRITNPQLLQQLENLKNQDYKIKITGAVDSNITKIFALKDQNLKITFDTSSAEKSIQNMISKLENIKKPITVSLKGDTQDLDRLKIALAQSISGSRTTNSLANADQILEAAKTNRTIETMSSAIKVAKFQQAQFEKEQEEKTKAAAIKAYNNSLNLSTSPQGAFSPITPPSKRLAENKKEIALASLTALLTQGPVEAAATGVGGIFGATGSLGTSSGLALGGLLGFATVQAFERIGEALGRASEAGRSFEQSILGISAIFQSTSEVTGRNGSAVPLGKQLAFQQSRALEVQQTARARLLPLGISGEKETTLVQAIISGAAQRGIQLTADQASTLAERIGGTIQAQRPELFNNSAQVRRDVEDLLSGLPNRTVLGSLVKSFAPNLGKATSAEELIKNSQGLASFPESLKESKNNPIVAFQQLNAAIDQFSTRAGDSLNKSLIPGLQALTETLSRPESIKNIENLTSGLGTFASAIAIVATKLAELNNFLSNPLGIKKPNAEELNKTSGEFLKKNRNNPVVKLLGDTIFKSLLEENDLKETASLGLQVNKALEGTTLKTPDTGVIGLSGAEFAIKNAPAAAFQKLRSVKGFTNKDAITDIRDTNILAEEQRRNSLDAGFSSIAGTFDTADLSGRKKLEEATLIKNREEQASLKKTLDLQQAKLAEDTNAVNKSVALRVKAGGSGDRNEAETKKLASAQNDVIATTRELIALRIRETASTKNLLSIASEKIQQDIDTNDTFTLGGQQKDLVLRQKKLDLDRKNLASSDLSPEFKELQGKKFALEQAGLTRASQSAPLIQAGNLLGSNNKLAEITDAQEALADKALDLKDAFADLKDKTADLQDRLADNTDKQADIKDSFAALKDKTKDLADAQIALKEKTTALSDSLTLANNAIGDFDADKNLRGFDRTEESLQAIEAAKKLGSNLDYVSPHLLGLIDAVDATTRSFELNAKRQQEINDAQAASNKTRGLVLSPGLAKGESAEEQLAFAAQDKADQDRIARSLTITSDSDPSGSLSRRDFERKRADARAQSILRKNAPQRGEEEDRATRDQLVSSRNQIERDLNAQDRRVAELIREVNKEVRDEAKLTRDLNEALRERAKIEREIAKLPRDKKALEREGRQQGREADNLELDRLQTLTQLAQYLGGDAQKKANKTLKPQIQKLLDKELKKANDTVSKQLGVPTGDPDTANVEKKKDTVSKAGTDASKITMPTGGSVVSPVTPSDSGIFDEFGKLKKDSGDFTIDGESPQFQVPFGEPLPVNVTSAKGVQSGIDIAAGLGGIKNLKNVTPNPAGAAMGGAIMAAVGGSEYGGDSKKSASQDQKTVIDSAVQKIIDGFKSAITDAFRQQFPN